jgi:hypothetical protein
VQPDIALEGLFDGKLERIATVMNPGTAAAPHMQGEVISPLRAVTNCYDMDNFTRAEVTNGTNLIKQVHTDSTADVPLDGGFVTWNRIRLLTATALPDGTLSDPGSMLHIELNQAYHTGWRSTSCKLERGAKDNLVASCPIEELAAGPVDLVFSDPVSELGARVSLKAGLVLGVSISLLTLAALAPRRRPVVVPTPIR